jgi:hypothetical protein
LSIRKTLLTPTNLLFFVPSKKRRSRTPNRLSQRPQGPILKTGSWGDMGRALKTPPRALQEAESASKGIEGMEGEPEGLEKIRVPGKGVVVPFFRAGCFPGPGGRPGSLGKTEGEIRWRGLSGGLPVRPDRWTGAGLNRKIEKIYSILGMFSCLNYLIL